MFVPTMATIQSDLSGSTLPQGAMRASINASQSEKGRLLGGKVYEILRHTKGPLNLDDAAIESIIFTFKSLMPEESLGIARNFKYVLGACIFFYLHSKAHALSIGKIASALGIGKTRVGLFVARIRKLKSKGGIPMLNLGSAPPTPRSALATPLATPFGGGMSPGPNFNSPVPIVARGGEDEPEIRAFKYVASAIASAKLEIDAGTRDELADIMTQLIDVCDAFGLTDGTSPGSIAGAALLLAADALEVQEAFDPDALIDIFHTTRGGLTTMRYRFLSILLRLSGMLPWSHTINNSNIREHLPFILRHLPVMYNALWVSRQQGRDLLSSSSSSSSSSSASSSLASLLKGEGEGEGEAKAGKGGKGGKRGKKRGKGEGGEIVEDEDILPPTHKKAMQSRADRARLLSIVETRIGEQSAHVVDLIAKFQAHELTLAELNAELELSGGGEGGKKKRRKVLGGAASSVGVQDDVDDVMDLGEGLPRPDALGFTREEMMSVAMRQTLSAYLRGVSRAEIENGYYFATTKAEEKKAADQLRAVEEDETLFDDEIDQYIIARDDPLAQWKSISYSNLDP